MKAYRFNVQAEELGPRLRSVRLALVLIRLSCDLMFAMVTLVSGRSAVRDRPALTSGAGQAPAKNGLLCTCRRTTWAHT